jgi:hypothetical protein
MVVNGPAEGSTSYRTELSGKDSQEVDAVIKSVHVRHPSLTRLAHNPGKLPGEVEDPPQLAQHVGELPYDGSPPTPRTGLVLNET